MDGRRRRLHSGRISRKRCPGKDDLGFLWRTRRKGFKWSFFYHRGKGGELHVGAIGRGTAK